MSSYNEYIGAVKKRFIETGEIPKNVRPEILQSWIKCKAMGLHNKKVSGTPISGVAFQDTLQKNKDLIDVAIPIMENIISSIRSVPTVLCLSDANGCILKVVAPDELMNSAKEFQYWEGCTWLEKDIGTNAMTLCTQMKVPVQTIGEENFCDVHTRYTCTGVPILSSGGEVLGAINSVNDMNLYSKYTLGMMTAGAAVIEKQMTLVHRTSYFLNVFEGASDGMIVADSNYRIDYANASAATILGVDVRELAGKDLSLMVKGIDFRVLKSRIHDKHLKFNINDREVNCIGTISMICFNSKRIGTTIVFKTEHAMNKSINKLIGNKAKYTFDDIFTQNDGMNKVKEEAKKISDLNCSVLITGESGTGKELFAQAIHNLSNKSDGPFVAINCAALPRELVESELFGYEEGAFTGGRKNGAVGKFQLANGGTIFLDEIGEMPLEIQAKLLRVLDNRKVMRLGGTREHEIDVRILAATNRDLEKMVAENSFRLDLYYRLSVVTVEIPPLKERKEDIPMLCDKFISMLNKEGVKHISGVTDDYLELLMDCDWNGNIRELQNSIARSYYICDESIITGKYLTEKKFKLSTKKVEETETQGIFGNATLKNQEKNIIIEILNKNGGNVTQTAIELGISKPTMYRKLKKYNIDIDRKVISSRSE